MSANFAFKVAKFTVEGQGNRIMNRDEIISKYVLEPYQEYFRATFNKLPEELQQKCINFINKFPEIYNNFKFYEKTFPNNTQVIKNISNINNLMNLVFSGVSNSQSNPLILINKLKNEREYFIKFNFELVNKIDAELLNDVKVEIPVENGFIAKYYNKSLAEQLIITALSPIFTILYGNIYIYLSSFKDILEKFPFENCIELYDDKVLNSHVANIYNWFCQNRNNFIKYRITDIMYINVSVKGSISLYEYLASVKIFSYSIVQNIKIILFCILITLTNISDIYPNFRHNDLHVGNIMLFTNLSKLKPKGERNLYFSAGKYSHEIPDYTPFIIDFNRSELPELGIYNKNMRNIIDKSLIFDDMYILLNSIFLVTRNTSNEMLDDLLYAIDPTQSFIRLDITYTVNKFGKKPNQKDILNNPIWNDILEPETNKTTQNDQVGAGENSTLLF